MKKQHASGWCTWEGWGCEKCCFKTAGRVRDFESTVWIFVFARWVEIFLANCIWVVRICFWCPSRICVVIESHSRPRGGIHRWNRFRMFGTSWDPVAPWHCPEHVRILPRFHIFQYWFEFIFRNYFFSCLTPEEIVVHTLQVGALSMRFGTAFSTCCVRDPRIQKRGEVWRQWVEHLQLMDCNASNRWDNSSLENIWKYAKRSWLPSWNMIFWWLLRPYSSIC